MSAKASLEKKVAQLLMVGVPKTQLDRQQANFLSRVPVGGVILFKENYEAVPQLVELCNDVQKTMTAEAYEGLPALIAVDHEGGRVHRFKDFTHFPPQAEWGALNSPKTCFEAGYAMAKELAACGVNMNCAPVIDVTQNPVSKAIGDRAYSSDPEVVANLGSATMRGMQKGGVLAVAKHFPGHGSAAADSHAELPICEKTLEDLDKLDWTPFRRVIRSKVEGVMTAHMLCPKIDPERPATLSRKFLQDILRKSLRHQKLIFSDDLEMGAIVKKYSLKDAAFLAIEAGCDQILLCHQWDKIEEVWQSLVQAFEQGALPMKRLDESVARIADAKKRLLMPFKFANKELAQALVGAPEFKAVAQAIQEKRVVEEGPSAAASQAR